MDNRFKFRIWNGTEMHYNDFVVTATGFVGKITEEFLGKCVFNQEDLTTDKECVLMQSTGLKDKNGKLIYEGDIVTGKDHFYRDRLCEITYSSIYCCFFIVGDKWSDEYLFNLNDKEVIGNVYENADLLRGEKQCI